MHMQSVGGLEQKMLSSAWIIQCRHLCTYGIHPDTADAKLMKELIVGSTLLKDELVLVNKTDASEPKEAIAIYCESSSAYENLLNCEIVLRCVKHDFKVPTVSAFRNSRSLPHAKALSTIAALHPLSIRNFLSTFSLSACSRFE